MFGARCDLRWSDLDAQGHVNNAVLLEYLQEARVMFFSSGAARQMLEQGVVVTRHQVEYLSAISYEQEPLRVEIGVAAVGLARIELVYQVHQADRLVAQARTTLCPFDLTLQSPRRLLAAERAFFQQHLVSFDPLRPVPTVQLGQYATIVPVSVRWTDLDRFNHVNNAKVFDLLQQARIVATTQWDPAMARSGTAVTPYRWLIARQDVDYLHQIAYSAQPYQVAVAPVQLGTSSIVLVSEIREPASGEILVRSSTVLVCADAHGRKTILPESLRVQLAKRLVAAKHRTKLTG